MLQVAADSWIQIFGSRFGVRCYLFEDQQTRSGIGGGDGGGSSGGGTGGGSGGGSGGGGGTVRVGLVWVGQDGFDGHREFGKLKGKITMNVFKMIILVCYILKVVYSEMDMAESGIN